MLSINPYLNHFSAITGSALAVVGQKIKGMKTLHTPSIYSYGLFGLCFSGTVPYYFNEWIIKNIPRGQLKLILSFLAGRAILAPLFIALYLYFMPIFEVPTYNLIIFNLRKPETYQIDFNLLIHFVSESLAWRSNEYCRKAVQEAS